MTVIGVAKVGGGGRGDTRRPWLPIDRRGKKGKGIVLGDWSMPLHIT